MSSKKGAFIYQQIELTTAEWAVDTTIYPASIWLFERLETGKFNMKLADGVHLFAELPAVMQDIKVAVKTDNDTTYILTITTAAGSFDTPNIKGQNGKDGQSAYLDAKAKGYTGTKEEFDVLLAKSGLVMTAATASTAGKSGLVPVPIAGAQAKYLRGDGSWQTPPNTTYSTATQSANGLMSSADKKRLDGAVVLNDVGTVNLSALPVDKYSLKYTYSSASPVAIAFSGVPEEGREFMLDILNSTAADIEQPIPNAAPWQSEDATVPLAAGKVTPISIRYVHGKYCVRT